MAKSLPDFSRQFPNAIPGNPVPENWGTFPGIPGSRESRVQTLLLIEFFALMRTVEEQSICIRVMEYLSFTFVALQSVCFILYIILTVWLAL